MKCEVCGNDQGERQWVSDIGYVASPFDGLCLGCQKRAVYWAARQALKDEAMPSVRVGASSRDQMEIAPGISEVAAGTECPFGHHHVPECSITNLAICGCTCKFCRTRNGPLGIAFLNVFSESLPSIDAWRTW